MASVAWSVEKVAELIDMYKTKFHVSTMSSTKSTTIETREAKQ